MPGWRKVLLSEELLCVRYSGWSLVTIAWGYICFMVKELRFQEVKESVLASRKPKSKVKSTVTFLSLSKGE